MLDKIITFSAHEEYVNYIDNADKPCPIKTNIPDWYKKLKHSPGHKTIKGCMPFLDSLTSGYLLKVPQDMRITHNITNPETGKKDSFAHAGQLDAGYFFSRMLNLAADPARETHNTNQLTGAPHIEKNKNLPLYKILNPWIIKTPPGYSCLFLPPMNNADDRFSIIPAIVDTDKFTHEVNFPIVINGDKYETLETIIRKGTPYVQVIPFKRDSWKMKIEGFTVKEIAPKKILYFLKILDIYKEKYWSKKRWT